MSSYKKLRLDPELPVGLRNQSGANDSGGRGFLDGSSFSSSTSGGSGAYGRSTGPYRTRYSQPMGSGTPSGNSFSRFAPYYFGKERRTSLRVPLIRARRDDSDSEGNRPSSRASLNSSLGGDSTTSGMTSTAQRIVETLQNLSTPVMNAGKIRIDQDLKAVQPLSFGGSPSLARNSPGGSLNRSTGPPKMCSSLLLSNPSPANQTSPMFNSVGDQRRVFCIPRMIDAATNTEKELSSPTSPSQMHFSHKAVTTPTTSPFTYGTNMKPIARGRSKDDNSEEEFHECNTEFNFTNSWGSDVFDRFLSSGRDDRSISRGSVVAQQQPLINGFKDAPTSVPQLSSKNISSFSGFSGASLSPSSNVTAKSSSAAPSLGFSGFSTGSSGTSSFGLQKDTSFGKSPMSLSSNAKDDSPKPFGSGGITSGTASKEINKMGAGTITGFSFGKPGSSPLKSLEPSKSMSFGNLAGDDKNKSPVPSVDKVDAPKVDSISAAKSPFGGSGSSNTSTLPPLSTLTKKSTAEWRCTTCMVENDVAAVACACCGEKNASSQISTAPKPATTAGKKKWTCPTCMVGNDPESANCVCCSEKNPNPVPASSAPLSSLVVASKKWTCPTCMVGNDPAAANCACCSEKNPNPVVSDKKDSSNAAGTASAPTFKFGVSSAGANTPAPATGSFVFGASSTQSDIQKPPASGFKFGLQPATSSASTTPAPVSTTPLVTAAASQPTSTTTASTFKFGSTTPSSTASPAAPAPSFGFSASTTTSSQMPNTTNTATNASGSIFSAPKLPEPTSSSNATGGIFGASNFQTPQSTPSNSFKFGSSTPTTTNDAQNSSATPSFSFGAAASTKPAFNNFSFGDRQQNPTSGLPGATSSIMTPAAPTSTPAPSLGAPSTNFSFGSSNPSASPFGQTQSNPNNAAQPPSGGLFQFGRGASSNPQTSSMTPSPAPAAFNLTPNLNFGATPGSTIPFGNPTQPTPNAGSQPPPALFQFSSTPNPSDSPSGRRIKKAVRRFNK